MSEARKFVTVLLQFLLEHDVTYSLNVNIYFDDTTILKTPQCQVVLLGECLQGKRCVDGLLINKNIIKDLYCTCNWCQRTLLSFTVMLLCLFQKLHPHLSVNDY